MNPTKQRNPYWDYLKAVAIILVVIGHSIEVTNIDKSIVSTVDLIVYSLHVPTFLFVSGHFMRFTFLKPSFSCKKIIQFKFLDLIVVWIVWSILLTLWNIVVDIVFNQYNHSIIKYIRYSTNEIWYLWFLFLGYFFFSICHHLTIDRYVALISILLFSAFIICSFFHVGLAKIAVHLFIIWTGYLFINPPSKKFSLFIIVLYLCIMIYILTTGVLTLKAVNKPGIGAFALLSVKIIGGLFIPSVFSLINSFIDKSENFLSRFGQKTLYIYVLHFFPLAIYKAMNFSSVPAYVLALLCIISTAYFLYFVINKSNKVTLLFHPSKQISITVQIPKS